MFIRFGTGRGVNMLNVGDQAPDVELPGLEGGERTLSELLGGESLILYFYPADFSPVCTREACAIRDKTPALDAVGVRVLGVSTQGETSHQRFRAAYQLPFPLISDPARDLIKAFGVEGPFGIGVRRATFLIGPDRVIRSRAVADLFLGDHLALIEEAIAAQANPPATS